MKKELLLLSENLEKDIKKYFPSEQDLLRLANHFYIFSDLTRLKIISCLSLKDMCVNDISTIININQSTLSHQLKILRADNIVNYKRIGKIIVYSLVNKKINQTLLHGVDYLNLHSRCV